MLIRMGPVMAHGRTNLGRHEHGRGEPGPILGAFDRREHADHLHEAALTMLRRRIPLPIHAAGASLAVSTVVLTVLQAWGAAVLPPGDRFLSPPRLLTLWIIVATWLGLSIAWRLRLHRLLVERRLCLRCERSLKGEATDGSGRGCCPGCGTPFLRVEYEPITAIDALRAARANVNRAFEHGVKLEAASGSFAPPFGPPRPASTPPTTPGAIPPRWHATPLRVELWAWMRSQTAQLRDPWLWASAILTTTAVLGIAMDRWMVAVGASTAALGLMAWSAKLKRRQSQPEPTNEAA